ncbi:fimbrial protein [Escherichia coli]
MKYNNIIFLGLCLGLTTYSALSADSVIKISGRVLDYGCTVSSDSLNFTVDLQKNSARQFPTTGSTSPAVPFQITLSECSKGTTGVRVAFNGIEDAENNTLLKLDEGSNTASGLGIEILDANRGARRIRKKSYAKVFRASVRAETSRLPVCGSAARRNRRLG